MKMLKLTSLLDKQPVLVNPLHIVQVFKGLQGTGIELSTSTLLKVMESVHDVEYLITDERKEM